ALVHVGEHHRAACHHLDAIDPIHEATTVRVRSSSGGALLEVTGLEKGFRVRTRGRPQYVEAVSGVHLDLRAGETLGLVGELGCCQTTAARLPLRLDDATAGSIVLAGTDVTTLDDDACRPLRRRIQMVFQDPYASLIPRLSVHEIVAEPLL